jgi:hypothetical protein
MAINFTHSPHWPQVHFPLAYASQMLGLQVCAGILGGGVCYFSRLFDFFLFGFWFACFAVLGFDLKASVLIASDLSTT